MANPLRGEVVQLYKNLLYLGREYPKGGDYFRDRLRSAFSKNKSVQDQEQIKALIARGEFVARELEALYFLRKYRAMKKRYYEEGVKGSPNLGRCLPALC
uniref:LYR motif containing 5b n=2 Tax=Oryzias latipes TaxID=8090 RepID=H2MHC9_ORYLA